MTAQKAEPTIDPKMLAYYARNSLLSFACLMWRGYRPSAHHRAIAQKLEAVERGEIKRLLISMPPRHGKSMLCSEFFPAWYLGRNPERMVIATTYAQPLATDVGRKVRNHIADDYFKQIFPGVRLASDSKAATSFRVGQRGEYFGVGVDGGATGRGAHLFMIDDPFKNREEADSQIRRRRVKDWYTSVAYTRLMPGGAIVIIQTRWHVDDLIGWVEKEHKHEKWDVLSLEAIEHEGEQGKERALWPSDYPLSSLKAIKKTLPLRDWQALYQQKPVLDGGNILKRGWWKEWKRPVPEMDFIIQSWDTAYSEKDHLDSSFSALTTWGVTKHPETGRPCALLMDAWKSRVDYPELKRIAIQRYNERQPDCVLIEKKASGQSLIQDLRMAGVPVITYQPDRDKVARANAVSSMLESGQIYYPARRWADELIQECAEFPSGSSDDYTDTCTQAWLRMRNAGMLLQYQPSASRPDGFESDDDTLFPMKQDRNARTAIYG